MEEELNLKLLAIIRNESWDKAVFSSMFSDDGSSRPNILLYDKDDTRRFLPMEIFDLDDLVGQYYRAVKDDPEKRFNKFELEVLPDKAYKARYVWEDEYYKKDRSDTARVFPQWLNDRMISQIYAFEFPNGPTDKDDDGDPVYVKTWNRGIFTFRVKNRGVDSEIVLYKNDVARVAGLKLPEYFIEALLEHYEITNNGILKGEWKSWNKLVILSPNNDLLYGKMDEHVFYTLE